MCVCVFIDMYGHLKVFYIYVFSKEDECRFDGSNRGFGGGSSDPKGSEMPDVMRD